MRRRLFFALWSDASFRHGLRQATAALRQELPGRPVAPLDWHVTLCFVGAVEAALLEPLQARAAQLRAAAFVLQFDRIEFWSAARVIAATTATVPAAALELAEALRALAHSMGLASEAKPLRPHVTLIRRAEPRPGGLPVALDLQLAACELHLAESIAGVSGADASGADDAPDTPERREAPRSYRTLARWPLDAGERA